MKNRFLHIFFLFPAFAFAQQYWQATTPKNQEIQKAYHLDLMALQKNIQQKAEVQIPTKNGNFTKYQLVENSNFSPELAKKYPNIKSYIGYAHGSELRLSVSPQKIDALVVYDKGGVTTLAKDKNSYNTYALNHEKLNFDFNCLTPEAFNVLPPIDKLPLKTDAKRRTYRTAIAVTGEYTQYHGGTKEKALAAVNASLTHVNAVLEKEVSVHLELIEKEDQLIFTDAKNDPFSDAQQGTKNGTWSRELQNVLDQKIGDANYDLGHLLGASFGGGFAADIGTVCESGQKGSAFTAPYDAKPEGINFDVDFLTHEIGHQLGATHIFSKKEEKGVASYVEPGSGSTIMGYAGIVSEHGGKFNVQNHSDNYFNQISVLQINYTLNNKPNCGKIQELPTKPPIAKAGEDYTIPAKTPFILKGDAEGTNKENYTYTWEQLNSSQSTTYTNADANSTTDPLFRSVKPSKDKERMFPSWNLVKKQMLTDAPFESLSNVARTLNFGLAVRDGQNYGQVATDHMTVNVQASETGFSVIKPSVSESVAKGGELDVKWNVAKTNEAPINVANVNVFLVTDQAGKMQKTLLKANASNDGEEKIQLPEDFEAEQAYILIEPVGNIFFAVSKPFSVGYRANNVCRNYLPKERLPLAIADGVSAAKIEYKEYTKITFSVPNDGLVNNVKLNLGISHQRMSDLQAYLVSPSGEMVEIFTKPCADSENSKINAEISDNQSSMKCAETVQNFKPQVPFASFNGVAQKGEWKLLVGDGVRPYEGKITKANLNLCANTFSAFTPEKPSGKRLELYPNPAYRDVNVKISNLAKPGVSFKIYNLVGQLIKQDENLTQTGTFIQKINIMGIPTGVYILQAEGNDLSESAKFIIE
ncbi:T9SS C-terminal target domain-containing protein [Ornithobacterium rhinotracheale]|uniref:zinc-dependent metalloprotease n=1 Tax=Ornithobacterium rhinotracheale TaxID=28251 RepID=UPI00129CE52F|nr:zinc-dependent metalloprotease family protein [Ornithobacterium rhinotracheale]MRI62807.1 T9SS C-terminal target domain-containing protein [Ornithobacterium rhinotracheale]